MNDTLIKVTCPVCDGEPFNYVPHDEDFDHWRELADDGQVDFYDCDDCNYWHVECLICGRQGFLYQIGDGE
jgi:C4-type Zn-finger protein